MPVIRTFLKGKKSTRVINGPIETVRNESFECISFDNAPDFSREIIDSERLQQAKWFMDLLHKVNDGDITVRQDYPYGDIIEE